LLYYFALSRELSFQEVVAFGNLGGVSVAKAKEVAAEFLSAYAEDHGLCPWMNA